MSTGATAAAAAAAAAIAQAIKASGVIVRVEPIDFLTILQRQEEPLVIHSTSGYFSTSYNYLTSYKGLGFFATSSQELDLPVDTELIRTKTIWIPG
ncbi:MAG: hypothetical protein SH850_19500 [Planctomycetaceae bacterium]|nr:hypothetical protein [Planctomycetaceae bacterium]